MQKMMAPSLSIIYSPILLKLLLQAKVIPIVLSNVYNLCGQVFGLHTPWRLLAQYTNKSLSLRCWWRLKEAAFVFCWDLSLGMAFYRIMRGRFLSQEWIFYGLEELFWPFPEITDKAGAELRVLQSPGHQGHPRYVLLSFPAAPMSRCHPKWQVWAARGRQTFVSSEAGLLCAWDVFSSNIWSYQPPCSWSGSCEPTGTSISFIFQESHMVAGVADGRVFFSGGRKTAMDWLPGKNEISEGLLSSP